MLVFHFLPLSNGFKGSQHLVLVLGLQAESLTWLSRDHKAIDGCYEGAAFASMNLDLMGI